VKRKAKKRYRSSPAHKRLASPLFRQRVVKAKKGKRAYKRKGRRAKGDVEP